MLRGRKSSQLSSDGGGDVFHRFLVTIFFFGFSSCSCLFLFFARFNF